MSEITTEQAVKKLCKALVADEGYWYSWKANIAMAFKDEFDTNGVSSTVHEIANNAADNFLKLLCRDEIKEQSQVDIARELE